MISCLGFINTVDVFFNFIPEILVNIPQQAIVSYLCLNLAITPIFIACQTQLMLSVFSVLFFFINTSLLLITLGLEYLGLAILLVYAGAIIMILLFVIMLVKLQETEEQPFSILTPSKWDANFVTIQPRHIKTRSIFLILIVIFGAGFLTFSCKSLIADLQPGLVFTTQESAAPALSLFSELGKVKTSDQLTLFSLGTEAAIPRDLSFIRTYTGRVESNHIP